MTCTRCNISTVSEIGRWQPAQNAYTRPCEPEKCIIQIKLSIELLASYAETLKKDVVAVAVTESGGRERA